MSTSILRPKSEVEWLLAAAAREVASETVSPDSIEMLSPWNIILSKNSKFDENKVSVALGALSLSKLFMLKKMQHTWLLKSTFHTYIKIYFTYIIQISFNSLYLSDCLSFSLYFSSSMKSIILLVLGLNEHMKLLIRCRLIYLGFHLLQLVEQQRVEQWINQFWCHSALKCFLLIIHVILHCVQLLLSKQFREPSFESRMHEIDSGRDS